MKNVVIAPVGNNLDAIFIGIREFPTERIILIAPKDRMSEAMKVKEDLERFKIPTNITQIEGNIWEETFKKIAAVKKASSGENIIVNVASGDREMQCAATSGAFVNGLKAFTVRGDRSMLLPVLKFSYYKLLTDKKMKILETIYAEKDCCSSLDMLSKKTKMSLPLISYHINGTPKSEGLKTMGLIEVAEGKGRTSVSLSLLGRLLLKGYIDTSTEKK